MPEPENDPNKINWVEDELLVYESDIAHALHLRNVGSAIFDLDNCLVEGRVAEGIGARFLKRQLKRGRIDHVVKGILGQRRVREILESGGRKAEVCGMEEFMWTLCRTGIATRERLFDYAYQRVEKHALPGAKEFIQRLNNFGIETYILTLGLDVSAKAAGKYFGVKEENCYGNPVVYKEDGVAKGCDSTMWTGADKLKLAREKGLLNDRNSIAVGNDYLDWPLMSATGATYSMSSPTADSKTRGLATFPITDYKKLAFEIKSI
ncbi:MAG TPA: HAD family hydrolase [archaeon]|nr:HAD family hydrolase [archaeon]